MNKEVTEKEVIEDLKISRYVFNSKFSRYQYIREDLIQESLIALMKARKIFDKTKCSYITFACKVVTNAMKMYLRKEYKHEDIENIEDYMFEIEDKISDLNSWLHIKTTISKVIKNSKKPLVIETIVNLLCQGYNGIEIAEHLGMSRTYISKLINTFRKNLSLELLNL